MLGAYHLIRFNIAFMGSTFSVKQINISIL